MTHPRSLLALLALVPLLGAGCFSGGQSANTFSVWKSVNGGTDWTQKAAYPTPEGVGSVAEAQVNELVLDPSDRFALYVGSMENGLLYSYDGADGWMRPKESFLREGRVRAVAVDPKNKCVIFASRGQKVARSEDCARTWDTERYVDPRSDVIVTDIAVDWFNPNIVYLGNTAGEVIKSTDGGLSWTTIYRKAGLIRDVELGAGDSRVVLVGTAKQGILRSPDGGVTWQSVVDTDLPAYKNYKGINEVYSIVQTKSGSVLWATTVNGLMRSNDVGVTWQPTTLITPPAGVGITAVAVNQKDGEHVAYVAGNTLYTTLNGGARWETDQLPSGARAVQLLMDPQDPSILYMGLRALEETGGLF